MSRKMPANLDGSRLKIRIKTLSGLALVAVGTSLLGGALLAQGQASPAADGAPESPGTPIAAPAATAMSQQALLASLDTAEGRDDFLQQYCAACHNERSNMGGMTLEGLSTADPTANANLWERVVQRVANGEMPPPNARRPEAVAAHAFVNSLMGDLDAAYAANPYAGTGVIRRLNRTEYANAVRDLLAVDFPFTAELPADGVAEGFDNIGDALSMSPVLLESYLTVGRKVSELAVGVTDPSPLVELYYPTRSQKQWIGEGAPFGTRGGIVVSRFFAREGDYELRAVLNQDEVSPPEGVRLFRTRMRINPGLHNFVVTFPDQYGLGEGQVPEAPGAGGEGLGGPLDVRNSVLKPTVMFYFDGRKTNEFEINGMTEQEASFGFGLVGPPTVARVEIEGPYDPAGVVSSPSRERIFSCRPRSASEEAACANEILTSITTRAFRRDVDSVDMQPILAAYNRTRSAQGFDQAIAGAIREVLVSPDFLFRLEFSPRDAMAGETHQISDFELASRLSFFLWSSIPDDALLDAARQGQLKERAGLERQVRRMLADSRAQALVDNFSIQWLGLRDFESFMPDRRAYPQFDIGLRNAFEQETKLFLQSIIRENRSVLDVIDSDYTYLNEQLAGVYGIEGVRGAAFRRVELPQDSVRGGVLGQGSVLMVTSHTNATSPILRGKWILDNLLNQPPSPPPAGVPPLNEEPEEGRVLTTREQVERHRNSPVCASCHVRMDPFGFALENFDVIGRWRTADAGGPVDASGTLPSGDSFTGPSGLRRYLLSHPEQFAGATTARLMTYALGRPLNGRDQPTIRRIVAGTQSDGYRFEDIVLAIVSSTPFQMKQASQ